MLKFNKVKSNRKSKIKNENDLLGSKFINQYSLQGLQEKLQFSKVTAH
jgi:hypothetical protein